MKQEWKKYYQSLGRIIRDQRVIAGLSQTDVAESLGVTFQQVQKYENGTNRVPMHCISLLIDDCGLPAAAFTQFLSDCDEVQEKMPDALSSRQNLEFAKAMNGVKSEEHRKAIMQLIRTLN